MSTDEKLKELLEKGVSQFTTGLCDDRKGFMFATCTQGIQTGPRGNQMIANHQAVSQSLDDCLDQLIKQVDAITELKSESVIELPPRNGR